MKRHFVSFADARMKSALKRIHRQAEEMKFFDNIQVLNETDLPIDFREQHANLMKHGVRGFGYWIWKPYIIQRTLEQLNDGDELWYLDAGCHLNAKGRERLFYYAKVLEENPLGIAAFELESACSERKYTKMDLLCHLGVQDNADIVDSGQLCTGHIFIRKSSATKQFVANWRKLFDNIHLIDDTPSVLPNFPEFVEHRHDQSAFSLMAKLHGAAKLPGSETWPGSSRNWSSLENYPFWDKRSLGFTFHTIERIIRKIKRIWHIRKLKSTGHF